MVDWLDTINGVMPPNCPDFRTYFSHRLTGELQ